MRVCVCVCVCVCNPDISELSGPEKILLYPGFVNFLYINTGSNLGPDKSSLISGFLLYQGILYPINTVYIIIVKICSRKRLKSAK